MARINLKIGKYNCPSKVSVGGELASVIWNKYIVPTFKIHKTVRAAALVLGVSHQTAWRWRFFYRTGL